jgi:hypothetical protein
MAIFSTARGAGSNVSSNPYHLIAARNVFGLRPLQRVIIPKPAPVLPDVILTGITTILKGKRASLKIQFPAKLMTSTNVQYCILGEGEWHGPIQVLEIDPQASTVKINNSGTVTTITFPKTPPAKAIPVTPRPPLYLPRYRMQVRPR